jgi:hypothetical protein
MELAHHSSAKLRSSASQVSCMAAAPLRGYAAHSAGAPWGYRGLAALGLRDAQPCGLALGVRTAPRW